MRSQSGPPSTPIHRQPGAMASLLLALPRLASSITFLCLGFLTCRLGIVVHTPQNCVTIRDELIRIKG